MTEPNDIPNGTYTLKLGKTFQTPDKRSKEPEQQFHTLRYDFKPSSVSNDSETYIAFGNNGDVHVAVPNEGDNLAVFKGSKKETKNKECLLFFDKANGTVRLEKISSNVNVKKTRDLDSGTEQSLRRGIERLRATSSSGSNTNQQQPEQVRRDTTSSSDSSSDSDSGSSSDGEGAERRKQHGESSDSDDDEEKLLEKMMNQDSQEPKTAPSLENTYQNMPRFEKTAVAPDPRTSSNSEKYGLALSESSSDEES